jgi:hypothetical protein
MKEGHGDAADRRLCPVGHAWASSSCPWLIVNWPLSCGNARHAGWVLAWVRDVRRACGGLWRAMGAAGGHMADGIGAGPAVRGTAGCPV